MAQQPRACTLKHEKGVHEKGGMPRCIGCKKLVYDSTGMFHKGRLQHGSRCTALFQVQMVIVAWYLALRSPMAGLLSLHNTQRWVDSQPSTLHGPERIDSSKANRHTEGWALQAARQ